MLETSSIAIGDDHVALAETVRRFADANIWSTVVRKYVDAPPGTLPPYWKDIAELGWLGLHLPEAVGGSGFGFLETAIVLEELGRVCAPGPMLSTIWASAISNAAGGHDDVVRQLATGDEWATVSFDGQLAICGHEARYMVVPWENGYGLARTHGTKPADSLDPTQPLVMVTFDDVTPLKLERGWVKAITAALFAADLAGVAGWCVQTAADYAAVRKQFGRPIGQFQGVKHRCANMLVAAEQIRAVAWDAAIVLDEPASDSAIRLSTAAAGAIAFDNAVSVAKDCIQVLGGIGFTWEHDAHFYLRRALAARQLLGSTSWKRAVADAALSGARRDLSVDLPDEAERVRPTIAEFADRVAALPREEQRAAVVDGGYFVPHWDEPWGRNAQAVEQLVIDEEFAKRKIRRPNLQIGAWAAPTIAAYGTLEQQEKWVRPTLLGAINWCQLFSEPEAGSDLAALKTTATKTDGGWLLNGQKVWTSFAREADWGMCLARTNPNAPKHLGITYFIIDMKSPGLDIRPLKEMTGLEMFNEVFINDVFVPDENVIGEVDEGWPLARTTLANERVAMGSGSSFGGGIEALLALCADINLSGQEDELGALVAESHTVALLGLRSTHRSVSGAKPGPEASVRKLLGVEHDQRTQEFGLGLLGPEGATTVGRAQQWTFGFLANRCLTIAGGTSEIQRNVIGERLLGLPRIPKPMAELLTDQLRTMAEHFADRAAAINVTTNEEMTFAEWNGRSNQLARWLTDQGVAKGDRVAILIGPDAPFDFLVAYSAAHKAGAVAVPLNTRLVDREREALIDHSGAKVVLRAGELVCDGDDSNYQVPLDSTDMADVMYTSGTTGLPKGVVVRHGNIAMVPNGTPQRYSTKGWLHASPMFTFAGIASTYNPMKLGMALLYMPKFDVDAWFDVVEQRKPRATFVVPAMAELLIASPRFADADLSSLTICSLGSAPVAPGTVKILQDKMPKAMVSNAWGMTEAGPAFCFMPEEERDKRVGSVGKPMPPTEFRIVDETTGDELPPRAIGELVVRNPGREREYFNDPEATAATWRDGWLHSGDLAYLDEDGFLYIVGRAKDVIIRGGNNIHATDVEAILYEHPAVQEAAVASIPHDVLGEDVGAWIVLAEGATATDDDIKAFCAERLADYKVPRRITFVDELPRNATGKVVKKDLPGR